MLWNNNLRPYYEAGAGDGAAGSGGPGGAPSANPSGTPPAAPVNPAGTGTPPATPPATPPVDPAAIANQATLEFIKSMGYNSREELRAALQKQNPPKPGDPDPRELAEQNKILTAKLQEKETSEKNTKIKTAVIEAINAAQVVLHDSSMFTENIKAMVSTDTDGKIVVINETGDVRLNAEAARMTVAELVAEQLQKNQWMIKDRVTRGAGADPSGDKSSGGFSDPAKLLKEVSAKGIVTLDEVNKALGKETKK